MGSCAEVGARGSGARCPAVRPHASVARRGRSRPGRRIVDLATDGGRSAGAHDHHGTWLVQRLALLDRSAEHVIQRATNDEDLHLQGRPLTRRERRLRVDVLACQLGIGPHVSSVAGEACDHPIAVGGAGRDERFVGSARRVVVGDPVVALLDPLRRDREGYGREVARGATGRGASSAGWASPTRSSRIHPRDERRCAPAVRRGRCP